jgi:GT2 family glycosyltransferase
MTNDESTDTTADEPMDTTADESVDTTGNDSVDTDDDPLVSFVIVTHIRTEDAIEAIESVRDQTYPNLEIVVVASTHEDTYDTLADRYGDAPEVVLIPEETPEGPPAARNEAFRHVSGDFVVTIDDDAVLADADAAERVVSTFAEYPDVGLLSFRSKSYYDGTDNPIEIPYGPDGKHPDEQYYTTYFVGVGAAFRREVIENTRGFPEEYYYAKEELDLSFQVMDAGYEILYVPDLVVRHKKTPIGRPEETERWQLMLGNRMRVSLRHLPLRHVLVSTIVWSAYVLYETGGSVPAVLGAYWSVLGSLPTLYEQRDVVSTRTRQRIAELNGRLWY